MVAMSRMFSISSDVNESVPRQRSLAEVLSRGVSSKGFTNVFGVYMGMGIEGGRLRLTVVDEVGVASESGETGLASSRTALV